MDVDSTEEYPNDLARVGSYRNPRQANDDTLLILSMGLPYWMVPTEEGYEVRVETAVADEVILQLERSRKENRFWPRAGWGVGGADSREAGSVASVWGFLTYALVLCLTYLAQLHWARGFVEAGRMDVQGVWKAHEWWRIITALTLHADVPHLLGNLGLGCFFAIFVAQAFGSRLGWSLILWSGALGNLWNAAIHSGEAYFSIGASTAVFAAVGIISGSAMSRMIQHRSFLLLRDVLIPVFVAFVVLAWWGSSGENTDIIGHLMGLLSGLLLGFLFKKFPLPSNAWVMGGVAVFSLAMIPIAWWFAIR